MHSAPSVKYPVGRSVWSAALLLSLWLAGAAVAALWAWAVPEPGWRQALGAAAVAVVGAWAAFSWWRLPAGELAWDGRAWTWSGAAVEGRVELALDLQAALLLRWQGGGGAWLWLERRTSPARWGDVRRAVYSRANPDALQRTQPPSATP